MQIKEVSIVCPTEESEFKAEDLTPDPPTPEPEPEKKIIDDDDLDDGEDVYEFIPEE